VTPPLELAITATVLKIVWRVPFVLWIKDLVIDAAIQLGMMRNRFAIAAARWLEQFAYAQASALAVITQGFAANLKSKKVPSSKIWIVPDWVNVDKFHLGTGSAEFRASQGIEVQEFLVLYSGNVGAKQGLGCLLQAAHLAEAMSGVTFVIAGDGVDKQTLVAESKRLGLANLKFLPVQPEDIFPRMLAAADVLLVHQRSSVVDSVVPTKLLTYMASGRPVIAAVSKASETAKVVERAQCGIRIEPEQPEKLVEAIAALRQDPQLRQQLGENGRRFVEANFARPLVLSRLEAVLRNVAATNRSV